MSANYFYHAADEDGDDKLFISAHCDSIKQNNTFNNLEPWTVKLDKKLFFHNAELPEWDEDGWFALTKEKMLGAIQAEYDICEDKELLCLKKEIESKFEKYEYVIVYVNGW